MRRFTKVVAFSVVHSLCLISLECLGNTPPIQWRGDLPSALKEAEQRRLPVFAVFFMSWCGPSQYLLQTTFQDEVMADYVNQYTVPIKFDGEMDPMLFKEFGVYSFPSVLILRTSGEEVDRVSGAGEPVEEMLNAYRKVIENGRSPTELLKVLEVEPHRFEVKLDLLLKYAQRTQVDEALHFKDRIQDEHPDYYRVIRAEAFLAIADSYFSLKRYDLAIEYFEHIIRNFPEGDHQTAFYFISLSYLRSGRPERALDSLEAALREFPTSVMFYYEFLSVSLNENLSLQKASEIGEVGRGLTLKNDEKGYLCFLLANVYKALQNIEKAREVIDEAIVLDSQAEYIEFRDSLL